MLWLMVVCPLLSLRLALIARVTLCGKNGARRFSEFQLKSPEFTRFEEDGIAT